MYNWSRHTLPERSGLRKIVVAAAAGATDSPAL